MSAPGDDDAGRRGRAVRELVAWAQSEQTAKALEAMELLELTDSDIEMLFRNDATDCVVRIPWLGKVT